MKIEGFLNAFLTSVLIQCHSTDLGAGRGGGEHNLNA